MKPWGKIVVGVLVAAVLCVAVVRSLAPGGMFSTLGDVGNCTPDSGTVAASATRTLSWAGSDDVTIALPAQVRFVQGAAWSATVSGPADVISHVEVTDKGEFGFEKSWHGSCHGTLSIALTGPSVTAWTLKGTGALTLVQIDVPHLTLTVAGTGAASASGSATQVELTVAGTGSAELGSLKVQDISATIAGTGSAVIAPEGDATLMVAGTGTITLKTKPKNLTRTVAGTGKIITAT